MIQDFLNRQIETKKDRVGIAGFTLFARVRDTTNYKSQAPTTYLEDGSPIQDHIINEPLILTIEGNVGDIYIEKTAIEKRVNRVNELIGQTSIYLPRRTQSAIQKANALVNTVRDKVRQIDRAIKTGSIVLGFESPTKPPQEAFVDLMEALYEGKALVSIDMNYRTFDMMRITDLMITKDATNSALSFNITAQKIRTVQPVYRQFTPLKKNPAASVSAQTSAQSDKGAQAGKRPNESLLTQGIRAARSVF